MVSRTQYASLVSAIVWSRHLTWRWRGVFSSKGGRGKLWTLSLGFGGISVSGLSWVGPSRRITRVAKRMMRIPRIEQLVAVINVGVTDNAPPGGSLGQCASLFEGP